MKLTADNVRAVAKDCLFTADEFSEGGDTPLGAVIVEGIVHNYAFHPARLEQSRANIASMLGELDDSFRSDGGGGMSFLNACMTRHGEHWGEHPTMGLLFALGMGLGIVSFPLPRDMWSVLPGGVPYVTIDAKQLPVAAIAKAEA